MPKICKVMRWRNFTLERLPNWQFVGNLHKNRTAIATLIIFKPSKKSFKCCWTYEKHVSGINSSKLVCVYKQHLFTIRFHWLLLELRSGATFFRLGDSFIISRHDEICKRRNKCQILKKILRQSCDRRWAYLRQSRVMLCMPQIKFWVSSRWFPLPSS